MTLWTEFYIFLYSNIIENFSKISWVGSWVKSLYLVLAWKGDAYMYALLNVYCTIMLGNVFLHTSQHVWWTQCVFVPHRSLTRNTTQPGTASLGETLAATWPMRPSISFTSTWVRWPFCCSSLADGMHFLNISWSYIQYWLTRQRHLSFLGKGPLPFSVLLSTLLFLRIKKKRGHVKEMKHLYLFLSCYIRHVIF